MSGCSTLNAMDIVRAIFFSLALSITGYLFSLPSPSRSTLPSRACNHTIMSYVSMWINSCVRPWFVNEYQDYCARDCNEGVVMG